MSRVHHAAAVAALACLPLAERAGAYPPNFQDTALLTNLTEPVALAWSPDGRLFIGERGGRLLVREGATLHTALTLSVQLYQEQGLLGLALHPQFPAQPYVYLLYTPSSSPQTNGFHRVSRFTVSGNLVSPGSEVVLHSSLPTGRGWHVGGGLRTSASGHLYATVGDNGWGDGVSYAQELGRLEGKMIRLRLDGTIPSDNPFVGVAGAKPEIYHRGLRNPFRFALQPSTGLPFLCDVGQDTWEEIDVGPAGSNFGWPTYEGAANPAPPGITNPLYQLSTAGGAALVGCVFYGGGGFPAGYYGNFFFLDHVRGELGRMVLSASNGVVSVEPSWGQTATSGWGAGPVDLTGGPDGALYYTTLWPGTVRRVAYTGVTAIADPESPPGAALEASPNPFARSTRIRFAVRGAARATLVVHDLAGRRVRVLADGELPPGEHGVEWDGSDESGRRVPVGIYLLRLVSGKEVLTCRIARTL